MLADYNMHTGTDYGVSGDWASGRNAFVPIPTITSFRHTAASIRPRKRHEKIAQEIPAGDPINPIFLTP